MANRPAINREPPPWGHTFVLESHHRLHPAQHDVIGHPNTLHFERGAAVPFVESAHVANAVRGNPRHWPDFSTPGLHVPVRK